MGQIDLITFPNAAALAEAAARDWLALAAEADKEARPCLVALSGGRIAGHFLAATAVRGRTQAAARPHATPAPFASTHFFWADERCVPPSDPESNFALARHHLLKPLAIPTRHLHRIRGELAPTTAAEEAEAELRRTARTNETGQPVLDLVFLGMGEDGHVASLFPGEPASVMNHPAGYRPVVVTKPPPHRITLGYAALGAARQVWVMVSGAGKAKALQASLAPGGLTPLACVIASRSQTRVLVDRETAG